MKVTRRLWWVGALFLLTACGKVPESTEKARGVLSGVNLVLAMSVLVIVLAVGMIVMAIATDRFFSSRAALAEGQPPIEEEEEPEDEVVAGIRVGRASVPRWLYGAYVLIPVFAFAYIFSNIAPPQAAEPEATEAPSGPVEEATIGAEQIKFTADTLVLVAETDVTITFENNDTGVPHDLTVWKDEAAAQAGGDKIANTPTVAGGTSADVTFETPGAGETLFFNCTIHPTAMTGTIEAEAA